MLDYLKATVRNTLSIKIVLYIVGLLLSIPVVGMLYWIFDTSYLATFGIGPEFYSRPIFSSSLINVWLFISALKPFIWIWLILSLIIFMLILIVCFNASRKKQSLGPEGNTEVDDTAFIYKVELFFNLLVKAGVPALAFLLIGLSFIALITFSILFFESDSSELAKRQLKAYIEDKKCKDAFNDYHEGCYTISGEKGDDHLLLLNNKDVVIYMSRQKLDAEKEETFTVTVKNKLTQEKIVRLYKYVEKPKKSKK